MENELEKIIKNLKKLLTKDFDFINELSIQTNHITKDQLKKIIEAIDFKLDYLEPEIPKLKRR